jgi:DNA-binding transcriptional regulator YdaS (Cro superfamily)
MFFLPFMLRLPPITLPAETALERAKDVVGGPGALAQLLSATGRPITRQGVSAWPRVPAERVVDVERVTGVPRHELRPDLYDQ